MRARTSSQSARTWILIDTAIIAGAYSMANCCHPASGTMTTTLSGSRVGTEVLMLTGGSTGRCGTATLADAGGTVAEIPLTHCY